MTTPGNDLAVRNGTAAAYQQAALAISPGQEAWEKMQLAALAQLGLKDASEGDLSVFLHFCQRSGLDPFSRQVYMINRREKVPGTRDTYRDKWTIQTGIDGWRVIRDRAERRNGCRGIKSRFTYYDPDGNAHPVWVRKDPPVAIEMTYTVVEPGGREVPYTSILRFTEYVQEKVLDNGTRVAIGQWAKDSGKQVHMLEKCTEADAYRCAFPQDYSGIELSDAMPPAEDISSAAPKVTGEEIRNRRPPQQVRSEVVPPEEAPWPGDAAPARPARNADRETGEVIPDAEVPTSGGAATPATARPNGGGSSEPSDPHDDVLLHFGRLDVAGTDIKDYLTRLAGRPLASVESLNRKQAQWFVRLLAPIGSRDELEAAAVAAEERRAQDHAAEAGDSEASDE